MSPAVNTDYTLAGSVLAIPAGSTATTGSTTITAVDNDTDAPDKEVTVSATADNTQGIDGNPDDLTLTIEDDEPAPTVTLALSANSIGEAGGVTSVSATQSHPSSEPTRLTVSASAVSPAEAGDFSRVGSALTIAAGRTDSTGTVTLTTADNDVDAPDKGVTVSATARNDQGIADDPDDVLLTITDDDKRGLRFLPAEYSVREVSIDRYSVSLTSEPTADVTLTVAPSDTGLLRVSPISGQSLTDVGASMTLTFTPRNWSSPQRVGVLTQDDNNEEEDSTTIQHTAAGGDYAGHAEHYEVTIVDTSQEPTSITLRVDTPEIREDAGLTLVTLRAALDGSTLNEDTVVAVTIGTGTASADDFSASSTEFTLTIGRNTGNEEQTIGITPTNDGLDEGDETISVTGSSETLAVNPTTVTILDDDTRGVTLSTASLTVDENNSRTYTVVLDSTPSGDVSVTPSVTGEGAVTVEPSVLTFMAGNWSDAQTLTVSAGDDADSEDHAATVSHAVAGADYGSNSVTAASVTVTVDDDDGRGVRVSERDLDVDEGGSATYTVRLNTAPTGDVTVTPSISGSSDLDVQPASLTFGTGDWNVARTLTISAAADADADDDRGAVSHAVSGADYGDNGVSAPEVLVRVVDAGATSAGATFDVGPVRWSEADGGLPLSVILRVALLGPERTTDTPVTVLVRAGTASPTDYRAEPSALTLTIPANDRFGQTDFKLTVIDDAVDESEETLIISASASGLDFSPPEVVFTIVDDDERGFSVSRSSLTVDEGGNETYEVALTSEPTGTVTVSLAAAGAAEVSVNPESLIFTTANWDQARTVTVLVDPDPDAEDGEATITLSAAGADYEGMTGGEVVVTARDDGVDASGLRLLVSPDRVDEGGGQQTITVSAA